MWTIISVSRADLPPMVSNFRSNLVFSASNYPKWHISSSVETSRAAGNNWLRFSPRSWGRKQEVDSAELFIYFFFPAEISVISVSWLHSAVSLSASGHSDISGLRVTSHSSTTTKSSTGIRDRNFLQPVIDTAKVHESGTWKVPFQHFTVTRPHSARNTAVFHRTT